MKVNKWIQNWSQSSPLLFFGVCLFVLYNVFILACLLLNYAIIWLIFKLYGNYMRYITNSSLTLYENVVWFWLLALLSSILLFFHLFSLCCNIARTTLTEYVIKLASPGPSPRSYLVFPREETIIVERELTKMSPLSLLCTNDKHKKLRERAWKM